MTLIALTLAWLLGIFLADAAWGTLFDCQQPTGFVWGAVLASLLIGSRLLQGTGQRGLLLLFMLLLGVWRYTLSPLAPCFGPTDLAFYNGTDLSPRWLTLRGTLDNRPDVRDRIQLLHLRTEAILLNGDRSLPVRGTAVIQTSRYPAYRYGDLVTVRGALLLPPEEENFSYRAYLARRGVYSLLRYPKIEVLEQARGDLWHRTLFAVKERSEAALNRLLPEPYAALANGMLLGIESAIPQSVDDAFKATGTFHIIVISGSQVALVSGILYLLSRHAFGARWALLPATMGILLYTLMVGADPPVVRSAIMGFLFILARHVGRPSSGVVSLFFAALVMTALNPLTLWDASTQLSFAATVGLLLIGLPLYRLVGQWVTRVAAASILHRPLSIVAETMALTVGAQIMATPVIVYYFGRLPLLSLPANFLVLPAQTLLMGGAAFALGLALSGLWPLAHVAAAIPWLALAYTVGVVDALAAFPSLTFNQVSPVWLLLSYGLIGLVLARRAIAARFSPRLRGHFANLALLGLTAGVATLWLNVLRLPDGQIIVRFLDVGEGAATLITTPDGRHVLIDGGPSPSELTGALGRALPMWERTLEMVVLTRPESGYVAGLTPLLDRYRVDQVLTKDFAKDTRVYEAWHEALETHDITLVQATPGLRIELGEGAVLDVLGPDAPDAPLTLRLVWGEVSILFSELDEADEKRLLAEGWTVESDVLRVARQGSARATGDRFLAAVNPSLAVIPVGRGNHYGHPASEVMERLAGIGARVLRSDQQGTIVINTDGRRWWVQAGR